MIEVSININRENTIASVQAVRKRPLHNVEPGDVCTYQLYINEKPINYHFDFPYGDGVGLALEMLRLGNFFIKQEKHIENLYDEDAELPRVPAYVTSFEIALNELKEFQEGAKNGTLTGEVLEAYNQVKLMLGALLSEKGVEYVKTHYGVEV
jgi:hypothetical protein